MESPIRLSKSINFSSCRISVCLYSAKRMHSDLSSHCYLQKRKIAPLTACQLSKLNQVKKVLQMQIRQSKKKTIVSDYSGLITTNNLLFPVIAFLFLCNSLYLAVHVVYLFIFIYSLWLNLVLLNCLKHIHFLTVNTNFQYHYILSCLFSFSFRLKCAINIVCIVF